MNLKDIETLFVQNYKFEIINMFDDRLIILENNKIKATNDDAKEYLEFLFENKVIEEVLTKELLIHVKKNSPNKIM